MDWSHVQMVPADTSPEVARLQRDTYTRMPPVEKLRIAIELSEMVRELTAAGLRERLGLETPEQVRAALVKTLYGDAFPDSVW